MEAVRQALTETGRPTAISAIRDLSGGCIHRVIEVTLEGGEKLVAKLNSASNQQLFVEEAHGLRTLAATRRGPVSGPGTVMTPQPLATLVHKNTAVLLMTAIQSPRSSVDQSTWARFGAELAALHQSSAGDRYGFEIDNHIGSTFQPNSWSDDWVDFNAVNRLGFQLETARSQGLLDARDSDRVQSVIDRLDEFIPRRPKPALLHGDLWSGNALPGTGPDGSPRIAVIDPACSIGDGWADIAMMRLFGGFPQSCLDAYASNVDDHDDVETRIAMYQLYHVLNHANIFGAGYVEQAMGLAARLLR
jgi:protein-ribulosamine 3-kinase